MGLISPTNIRKHEKRGKRLLGVFNAGWMRSIGFGVKLRGFTRRRSRRWGRNVEGDDTRYGLRETGKLALQSDAESDVR